MAPSGIPVRKAEELRPLHYRLCQIAVPLGVIMFCIGSVGLVVLSDQEKEYWISRTKYADLYWKAININPMFLPLFFVGGGLSVVMSLTYLSSHKRALQEKKHVKGKPGKKTE